MNIAKPALPEPTAVMDLRMSGLLLVGLGVALTGMHSVLADFGWRFDAIGIVIVVLGAAAAARYYLRRRWVGTVAGIVAGFLAIVLFFGDGTAILGVIPTGSTLASFGALSTEAADSIARQSVPAIATVGIQFLVCWIIGSIAVVMDAVAIWWRMPAITGVPLLIVVAVPSLVQSRLSDPFFFELTAIVYLLIVRTRLRRVQPGVAVVLGAVAVLGALILPTALPPVSPGGSNGSGIGVLAESVNPIINLGADLRSSDPVTALTYTTTSATGEYLQLTTLENFQGKQWAPAKPKATPANSVERVGDPPGLTATVSSPVVTSEIQIANTTGQWLPTPYPPRKITGLTGSWFWEASTLAIRSDTTSMRGQKYTVDSLDVEPTVQQLRAAGSSASSPLAAVPAGLNPIVAATAKKVTAGAKTDFDKAVALQNWFRGGTFTYSTKTPASEGFDGSGLDVIVPFLEAKSGYCVHFATTMAVMARTLGIPSRIAVGFLPGKATHPDGIASPVSQYTVSSADMHAWPELYFKGVGWVRFEPTPSRGFEPNFPQTPGVTSSSDPANDPSSASSSAPAAAHTAKPSKLANDSTQKDSDASQGTAVAPATWVVFALLLLLSTPAFVRIGTRRRRIDRIRQGITPAVATWEELRESARDLGLDAGESETPQELSARLGGIIGASASTTAAPALAALAELREMVEGESYGLPAYRYFGEPMANALVVVLRGLRRASPLPQRLRATLLPATLVDRALGRAFVRA